MARRRSGDDESVDARQRLLDGLVPDEVAVDPRIAIVDLGEPLIDFHDGSHASSRAQNTDMLRAPVPDTHDAYTNPFELHRFGPPQALERRARIHLRAF